MIESLKLTNFQRHESLSVGFESGVNVIVGPSDVGKSAIIRSLRWALLNSPRGGNFIRHGEKSVSVEVKIGGSSLIRSRSGGENKYDLDGEKFSAFGSEVPADIARVLAIDSVNFQNQHDGPYWFDLSSSEVARRLNEVVDLQIVDKVSSSARSALNDSRTELRLRSSRLEENKKALDSLSWVDEAERDWVEIERKEKILLNLRDRRIRLKTHLENLQKKKRQLEELEQFLRDLNPLGRLGKTNLDLSEKRSKLRRLSENIVSQREFIDSGEGLFDRFKEIEKLREALESLRKRIEDLKNSVAAVRNARKLLNRAGLIENSINEIDAVESKSAQIREIKTRTTRLVSLISTADRLRKEENDSKVLFDFFSRSIEFDRVRIERLQKIDQLKGLLKAARDASLSISREEISLSSFEESMKSVRVCETCGNPI